MFFNIRKGGDFLNQKKTKGKAEKGQFKARMSRN